MTDAVPAGYNGKIVRVDLTKKTTTDEAINEMFCRKYIGGAGFITYYLWKELKQGADALGPDNKLIFALGPVSGFNLPGATRHCIGGKSPLTGGIAKAEVGGFWAAELKRAGYDAIIIEGKAEKPVYLWIEDGKVNIKDAGHLWGKETKETEATIRAELGDERIQVAMIGPGGENLVLYACVMHGLHDAAGRGGLGAVMGSKNLKAVAVRGHKLPKMVDKEKVKGIRQAMVAMPHFLSAFGTGGPELPRFVAAGNLPVRNFRDGLFPEVEQIHSGVMKATMSFHMEGCYACPVRCKKVVGFDEPYPVDAAYGGPEYETIAALGSNCGVGNVKAIVKGNERCGAYSLDTISTGVVIGFAMECFERGLLTTDDTDGIEFKFGNDEAMLKAIDLIATRKGFGSMLAEGTARMAEKIGKGSAAFAINVKGLEGGLHDPRAKAGFGLGQMVSPYGADHAFGIMDDFIANEMAMKAFNPFGLFDVISPFDVGPRKVGMLKISQCMNIITDSMVLCAYVPYHHQLKADLLNAITGWNVSLAEFLRIGERVITMSRLFNLREGLSGDDDVLPERFYEPKTDGVLADKPLNRESIGKAKSFYYTLMGWDAKGVPVPEKVEELGIQ